MACPHLSPALLLNLREHIAALIDRIADSGKLAGQRRNRSPTAPNRRRHHDREGGADTMKSRTEHGLPPSVDSSRGMKLLPGVLSVTAGSVDVIGFLGLGGLFTSHITGNLVVLAAHLANGEAARLAPMLSVPVFMLVLMLVRLLASFLEAAEIASLRPFLLLQFLLLVGFLALCASQGTNIDPNAPYAVAAGMLGVAAMAVQNALVQISLRGAPSTAVMTSNVTRFTMDIGTVLFGRDRNDAAAAFARAKHTWPTIVGFVAGCAGGAVCEATFGLWSLALPAGFALLAVVLTIPVNPGEAKP
jgi:uncharacterized membrane protein YoaK (UPF0700 family)